MILEEWLMQRFGAEKFAPGLERVRTFVAPYLSEIARLKPVIITVAGTNGKGQTAMSLAHHLKHNKKSFALWTSPHIERVSERYVSEAGEIDSALLRELLEFEAARAQAQMVGLSYYEILWAAFLRWVTLTPKEFLVLEVGLGGRLDAVNLLDAQIVALTSISRDHQEYLGGRYELILQEKLGVLRKGASLFSALESQYLNQRVERHSKTLGYGWFNVITQTGSQSSFWERNELLSQSIIESLALNRASSPHHYLARGESQKYKGHEFVFYGSHNPDGARKLIQLLQHKTYNFTQNRFDSVWVAMSQRSETDLSAMAKIFTQFQACGMPVCFTLFQHPKAAVKSGWWQSTKALYFDEWKDLLEQLEQRAGQKILVTGSYYFIAQLKSFFSQGR